MFWRKKDSSKVEKGQRPPVEQLGGFVEWLLRYGEDFDAYRKVVRGSMNSFISTCTQQVVKELETCADEASLTARIHEDCADFAANYQAKMETAGGLRNLPSHLSDKALPLLVRLRVMMYVRQYRYSLALTPDMLAVGGPLLNI
jgi:hypothetical protein